MKRFVKAICFMMILAVVFLSVQSKFIPFEAQDTNQANSFYNDIEEKSVDVLAIGASTILVNVCPLEMYKQTGIVSHVRGNSRQAPVTMWLNTVDAFKTQSPKLVIYNGTMLMNDIDFDKEEGFTRRGFDYLKFSIEKMKAANYICNRSEWQTLSSFALPLLRYHSRWTEFLSGLQPEEAGDYDFMHGQYAVYKTVKVEDERAVNMAQEEKVNIADSSYQWYKKSIDLCHENGAEVLMVMTPDMRWTAGKREAIAEACQKLGVKYLDYNDAEVEKATGIDWSRDAYNDHHLNVRGSIKFTDYLSNYIVKEFKLTPSDASDNVKNQFQQDMKTFESVSQSKEY